MNYKIQHRRAAYEWAREEQEGAKAAGRAFLDEAEPALAAHHEVTEFTAKTATPEAIAALPRAALWRKSPEEWRQLVEGQIATAKAQIARAELFLAAATHIPCAFYSQVRGKMIWQNRLTNIFVTGNATKVRDGVSKRA